MKRKYLVVVAVSIVSLLGSNVYYINKNIEYENDIAELKTTVHNATKESSEYLLQVNDLILVLKDKVFYLVSSVVYTCIIVGLCFVRMYLTV